MNKTMRFLLILISVCLFLFAGCSQQTAKQQTGYVVTDSQGTKVTFTKKPERILNYVFWLDDMTLGLVPKERLVAINHLADDCNSSNIVEIARQIPVKLNNPSAETVVSLKPDVVFLDDSLKAEVAISLRELGIKAIVCKKPQNVAEVKTAVAIVAAALGEPEKGKRLTVKMEEKLQQIQEKVAVLPAEKRKKVVVISMASTFGGQNSLFDNMCNLAAVRNGNVEAGVNIGQSLSKERLVVVNPDFLIVPVFNDHGTVDIKKFNDSFLLDPALQTVQAIKNEQIYRPHEGYIYNASQDMVFGAQDIAHGAYGELIPLPVHAHLSVVE